jgi:hypothetical protein
MRHVSNLSILNTFDSGISKADAKCQDLQRTYKQIDDRQSQESLVLFDPMPSHIFV